MQKRGLDILKNARTIDGKTGIQWLNELLEKKTRFWFGTERYTMSGGLHIIAGYYDNETGKYYDLGPRERDYIAEALYPQTQKIIDAHNEADKEKTSKKWCDFLKLLANAKIDKDLKKELARFGETGLRMALYEEAHAENKKQ